MMTWTLILGFLAIAGLLQATRHVLRSPATVQVRRRPYRQ